MVGVETRLVVVRVLAQISSVECELDAVLDAVHVVGLSGLPLNGVGVETDVGRRRAPPEIEGTVAVAARRPEDFVDVAHVGHVLVHQALVLVQRLHRHQTHAQVAAGRARLGVRFLCWTKNASFGGLILVGDFYLNSAEKVDFSTQLTQFSIQPRY